MSFGTAINCMDGRTQLPVNAYLKQQLEVDYIDTVTEPGPVRILAEEPESALTESILNRVRISTDKHGSKCVAIVAHTDCAGNPAPKDAQMEQLDLAVRFVAAQCPGIRILGLWVDETWSVTQICAAQD
jgi:Putative carbonic anhydrase